MQQAESLFNQYEHEFIEHFVEGKIFKGTSKKTEKVYNLATGEQSSEVKLANSKDVDVAVESAKKLLSLGLTSLHYKEQE